MAEERKFFNNNNYLFLNSFVKIRRELAKTKCVVDGGDDGIPLPAAPRVEVIRGQVPEHGATESLLQDVRSLFSFYVHYCYFVTMPYSLPSLPKSI